MTSSKIQLTSFAIYTAVVCIFLIRPSHLGEKFNLPGTMLLLVASLILFLSSKKDLSPLAIKRALSIPMLMLVFWSFIFIHGLYNEVSFRGLYLSPISAMLIGFSVFAISFNEEIRRKFTLALVSAISILGLSSVVSIAVNFFIPMDDLIIGKIEIPTYKSGDLIFPFSLGYDKNGIEWSSNFRLNAFWREVGIAQAIFTWAAAVLLFSPGINYRKFFIFGTVGGCLATQSTLAPLNLSILFFSYTIFSNGLSLRKKTLLFVVTTPLSGVLFTLFYTAESFGLLDKFSSVSFSDRLTSLRYGIYEFWQNPFGYGFYGNSEYLASHTNINLISSLGGIGVFGGLLYLMIWISSIHTDTNRIKKFFCILPIFLTALTSQPLIDSFGIYVILSLPAVIHSEKVAAMVSHPPTWTLTRN